MGCPGIQYYREKTQIIFFDLEFYVPTKIEKEEWA